MDNFIKDVKTGFENGTAFGSSAAAIYKVGANFGDGLEPACRAGCNAAGAGGALGGVAGAMILGSLSLAKTARHGLDNLHQTIKQQHLASHLPTDKCILCRPNDVLNLD